MTRAPGGGVRRSLALLSVGLVSAALAVPQSASSAAAAESPLPSVDLPVAAQNVTDTDTNLASTAREVVVMRTGADVPEITKLRARSSADAARLAASLDRLPGVTAARNQVYRVPAPAEEARALGRLGPEEPAPPKTGIPPELRIEDEPYGADEWGLYATGAEDAWTVTRGAGVTVAVVDTGVDGSHPDLVGRVLPQVRVTAAPAPGTDVRPPWHGTHVAGIIAASMNGVGIVGLANQSSVLPIRVLDDDGTGDTATVAAGVNEAVRRKVQVINLSLGGRGNDPVLARAIDRALAAGITVVAAAGNEHELGNPTNYPANLPGVIGVGSVSSDFRRSAFSNTGAYVDLVAPGEDIRSTYPGASWMWASGTSMAAPFVSAAAALVRAANPTLSASRVASMLFSTAWDDESEDGKDAAFGYGLVRADGAAAKAARLPGGISGRPIAVRVSARRAGLGNVLRVDVDPNKADVRSYTFQLQRLSMQGRWTLLSRTYRTEGAKETTTLRLPQGRYRVVVTAEHGYTSAVSKPVKITVPTVQVRALAISRATKMYVDVNPDNGKQTWAFRVQKRSRGGHWVTQASYRTRGSTGTRTLDLKAGTYRVVVAAGRGLAGAVSGPVRLVR
jgi:subtilisin family serine protease